MTATHWSIRQTERRAAQVARIGEATGLGQDFSAVVDYALSYTIAHQEAETMNEIYECKSCGQAVQGWHAAHGPYGVRCCDTPKYERVETVDIDALHEEALNLTADAWD